MPYRLMVCKSCDMAVHEHAPHGPEDEYCEGEEGYEYIDVFTEREVEQRVSDVLGEAPSPFVLRAADALFKASDAAVRSGRLDSRSPVGDAALDYRELRWPIAGPDPTAKIDVTAKPSAVHLWRCTHPLCVRVVQDNDVDHLRFLGRHTDDEDRIRRAGGVLFDKRNPEAPPKCIGGPSGRAQGGGWSSHRAAVMELVKYQPVVES